MDRDVTPEPIPRGWTPETWRQRLLQMAAACWLTDPDASVEYADMASQILLPGPTPGAEAIAAVERSRRGP